METDNARAELSAERPGKQLDFVWVVRYIFSKWKFIAISVGVTFALAMVTFMLASSKYTVETSLLPHEEQGGLLNGAMGNMAKMAGMDNKGGGKSLITPDLYPKVVKSTPFMLKMMQVPLPWLEEDSAMSTLEYVTKHPSTIADVIKTYTIGLPSLIMRTLKPPIVTDISALVAEDGPKPEYAVLTVYQLIAVGRLTAMITVEESSEDDLITLKVEAESPVQAAELASAAVKLLQEIVTDFKTKNSAKVVQFLEERYRECNSDYLVARDAFFRYKDSHRYIIEERTNPEYQFLNDEYDRQYSILKSIASKLEEAKLDLMQNTPVFSVVQPVVLPYDKSSPKAMKHIAIGVLLGLFFSLGYLILRMSYLQIFSPKKFKREFGAYMEIRDDEDDEEEDATADSAA